MKLTLTIAVVAVLIAGVAYLYLAAPDAAVPTPTPTATASATASPEAAGSVVYSSARLGVTFSYQPVAEFGSFGVLEEGNRISVYPAGTEPSTGQFVEVFQKRTDESFEASIRRQVLEGFPSPDCTVVLARSNIYPGAWVAEIGYPAPASDSEPFWANAALCNERYAKSNGIRYFVFDDAHPDRFVYLDIGQYAIPGRGNVPWHETLRITAL